MQVIAQRRIPMTMLERAAVVVAAFTIGCATAPRSAEGRQSLAQRADVTLQEMRSRDPGLGVVLDKAAGYAVFPEVGKGGLIVGGAFGRGVLYERGRMTGYVKVQQASLGAQLGGKTFSELLVLRAPEDVAKLKAGKYSVGADASVVALTAGAAASAPLDRGTTVFLVMRGGAMVDVSISGQRIEFVPMG
jgi:lipid-binding SYLF domain-containing protein